MPEDEKLAACLLALTEAHQLLSDVVRLGGALPPPLTALCQKWTETAFNPETQEVKPCDHRWKKAALDSSMFCTRCGIYGGEAC